MEQREFEIGGQVFRIRYPHWREGALLFDDITTPSRNGDESPRLSRRRSRSWLTRSRRSNGSRCSWTPTFRTRISGSRISSARERDPVPRFQLVQLYTWLVQVTDGRPTEPLSPSAGGGGDTDTSSPAESS